MRPMARFLLVLVFALAVATGLSRAPRAHAQDTGVAVITSPLEGAVLNGLVPITGSATHPQFTRYELAFGYSPNPTDTWFSIQAPSTSQVINEVLGTWDTTKISDGLYVLRLRVFYADGAYLETFVANVRVQNSTPAAPTAVPTIGLPATETPAPTATTPVIELPATSTAVAGDNAGGAEGNPTGPSNPLIDVPAGRINTDMISAAFLDGVRLTVISFLILGAYVALRAVLRWRR
jgi:hypothetical protein